jgi:hypothetical protein
MHGFGMDEAAAWPILCEYNRRCEPQWSDQELRHELDGASKLTRHPKPRAHLCGDAPEIYPRPPLIIPEPVGEAVRWHVEPHVSCRRRPAEPKQRFKSWPAEPMQDLEERIRQILQFAAQIQEKK